MNSKVFAIFSWILMVIGIIVPLGAIFTQVFDLRVFAIGTYSDYFYNIFSEGIIPGLIIFVLLFLPGLKFYKISKNGINNKLESWAVWLSIVAVILEVVLFILLLLTGDSEGMVWGMAIFGGFLLIPYAVGVLLLIINWFKQRYNGGTKN